MYAEGRGVPQDDTEAVKWYRRAADQGNAYAQFNLGVMYADGPGRAARRRRGGEVVIAALRTRVMPTPSPVSGTCTSGDGASRRTTQRR